MGLEIDKISISDLNLGQIVLVQYEPPLNGLFFSKDSLQCGIVSEIKPETFALSKGAFVNGASEGYYNSNCFKKSRCYKLYSNNNWNLNSIYKINITNKSNLKVGDFVVVDYLEFEKLNRYMGFVNELNNEQLILTNYHHNWRKPRKKSILKQAFTFQSSDVAMSVLANNGVILENVIKQSIY